MRKVHAFRVEPRGPPRRLRSPDERLFVRVPTAYQALSRLVLRLPPGSSLREALLRRSILTSFAAFNRRDFDVVLAGFARDIEYEAPAAAQTLGVSGVIRGRDGLGKAYRELFEDWERWELAPAWMLDLGDKLAAFSLGRARGRESGMGLRTEWASVYEMRAGLVVRQQDFLSWDEALRALEVDPSEVAAVSASDDFQNVPTS